MIIMRNKVQTNYLNWVNIFTSLLVRPRFNLFYLHFILTIDIFFFLNYNFEITRCSSLHTFSFLSAHNAAAMLHLYKPHLSILLLIIDNNTFHLQLGFFHYYDGKIKQFPKNHYVIQIFTNNELREDERMVKKVHNESYTFSFPNTMHIAYTKPL